MCNMNLQAVNSNRLNQKLLGLSSLHATHLKRIRWGIIRKKSRTKTLALAGIIRNSSRVLKRHSLIWMLIARFLSSKKGNFRQRTEMRTHSRRKVKSWSMPKPKSRRSNRSSNQTPTCQTTIPSSAAALSSSCVSGAKKRKAHFSVELKLVKAPMDISLNSKTNKNNSWAASYFLQWKRIQETNEWWSTKSTNKRRPPPPTLNKKKTLEIASNKESPEGCALPTDL